MSMHWYEEVVESSIRVLVEHDGGADLRDLFAALWLFQSHYDCSFTQGRVLDLLVKHRYTYELPLSAHPAYAEYTKEFKKGSKSKRDINFVMDVLGQDEDEDLDEDELGQDDDDDDDDDAGMMGGPRRQGNEEGYLTDGRLYCDAGTPLWEKLVEAKTIQGPDAEKPKTVSLAEVAIRVVKAAEKAKDRELIACWMALGPATFFGDRFRRALKKGDVLGTNPFSGKPIVARRDEIARRPFSVEEIAALPEAVELRDISRRNKAMEVELHDNEPPPPDERTPVEAWWFAT
ncbi:hypothetical protein AKJ09_02200 [Labilithrix luteola]|uniref:Uncharacterized protein n=1 Tax=Labilithrix luteola TaxID=1391654 RepID=A0A0K1PQ74_9BACT|nr:hypothetical protein [Labilithrix luteola]AKU95536.1 hypothetical protein AKJ09_02200 [Labilithrix luteola]